MIPFDAEFARRTRGVHRRRARRRARGSRVAIGENFRFGHKAQGDPRLLAEDVRFETAVHPPLEIHGEIVSSSHIRWLVLAGEVAEANRLLGARFELSGEVARWRRARPRAGIWTANLVPEEALACPGHGVYACLCRRAPVPLVSIGVRPTFHHRPRRADRGLHPRLRRRPLRQPAAPGVPRDAAGRAALRGPRRALIEQMHRDVQRTREIAAAG